MNSNFSSFESLAEYLDSVDYINCGGCGYSAFFIYEYLKGEGKNPEIAYIYEDDESQSYRTNEAALKDGKTKPAGAAHVVVKIGDKAYDSTGESSWKDTLDNWSYGNDLYHIVSEDFLLKSLGNRKRWNSMFDRDQEVPEMEKKIGINLPVK